MFKFVENKIKKYYQNKRSSVEEIVNRALKENERTKSLETQYDFVSKIINERYSIASQVLPVKQCIDVICDLSNSTPVELKDRNDNVVQCPIEELFTNSDYNISILHQSIKDFKTSFLKEMQINGITYLLVGLDESGEIINLEIVPTNYITMQNTNAFRGIVTSYMITNFLNINGQLRFDIDYENNCYIAKPLKTNNTEINYRLYATDFGFESNGVDVVNINLSKSPLIAVATQIECYRNTFIRQNSLITKGINGGLLDIQVATPDVDKITQIKKDMEENLKGSVNHGNIQVMVRQANPNGVGNMNTTYMPIGNTANDYNLENDERMNAECIYDVYKLPSSYLRQEAKYVGNQAESLKQIYNGKIFVDVDKMYTFLKKWLFPLLGYIPSDYEYKINSSKIDVFMQNQVAFIQAVGDVLDINEKRALLHYNSINQSQIRDLENTNVIEDKEIAKAIKFFTTDVN